MHSIVLEEAIKRSATLRRSSERAGRRGEVDTLTPSLSLEVERGHVDTLAPSLSRERRRGAALAVAALMAALVLAAPGIQARAVADVFHMPAGLTSLETVPVGNPGNAGELSGPGIGGERDRVCGSVGYTYNMGKYEVTPGQYTEFLNEVAGTDTYALYHTSMSGRFGCGITRSGAGTTESPYVYSAAPDIANRPVNYISFWDACRFANWLHNGQPTGPQGAGTTETGAYTLDGYNGSDGHTIRRNPGAKWAVPSEDEWYKAAYHKNDGVTGNYFDYPTGSDTLPGLDLADASGNNANYTTTPLLHPIDSGKYYTTVAGEFQNSASPYGTFDQAGNVCEWMESMMFEGYPYRTVRGGAWYQLLFYWETPGRSLQASSRGYWSPQDGDSTASGFRVAEVPEPGTLSLLALGGRAAIRRRRR
jgi:sulfatase modifying factor 1